VNGFTIRDLIRTELPQVQQAPDLVSVLIGANDVVQGYDAETYRRALQTIYDFVARFRLPAGSVLTSGPRLRSELGSMPSTGSRPKPQRVTGFTSLTSAK
jgi:lysophospholipase L1-like esterase